MPRVSIGLSMVFLLCFTLAPGNGTGQVQGPGQGEMTTIDVTRDRVITLHEREAGHAELPSLAISPDHAYVAYDVRLHGGTRVHLCRIGRGGEHQGASEEIISPEDAMSFGPSVAYESEGVVWLAWTSHSDGSWTIKGCRVKDMKPSALLDISGAGGLNSQVKAASRDGITWFTWVLWEDEAGYRIMANRFDGELREPETIYEGDNPLGRVDLYVDSGDRVVFAWDEYVDGRYAVRMRERTGDRLQPVEDVSGDIPSNDYEPSLIGGGEGMLAVWTRVPRGEAECRPAARVYPGPLYEEGLGSAERYETWRVTGFGDDEGRTWVLWLNRLGHTKTRMYARRVASDGVSETCNIRLRRQERTFMNNVECAYDRDLVLAWDNRGEITLCEIALPPLGRGELEAPEGDRVEKLRAGHEAQGPEGVEYTTVYEGDSLRVYFGDYHNHTSFSDGRAYPDMSTLFARDTRRLDFFSLTDHDGPLMPSEFAWNNEVADMLTRDGEFVCLRGFEISKGWAQNGFGHWNMLFPGPVTIVRYEEGMTPDDLYRIARDYGAILIPHHIGKKFAPHDWDYYDPVTEPVVEMCSLHGVFETFEGYEDDPSMVEGCFVEDGLARGYKLGFVGASDFHNCFNSMIVEKGLTGIYARSLSPEAIFEALRRRRTFATTGCHVTVDFRCNGRFMGEEVDAPGELRFHAYAESPDSIASMEIVSGGEKVFETQVSGTSGSFEWETSATDSETYYYLRVRTPAGGLAWSSPIWTNPRR